MKTIYKYPFNIEDYFSILMPEKAEILSVQTQKNIPCIWAIVDIENASEQRNFYLRGTGHTINENNLKFISTFQIYEGNLVFHLFEILN